MVYKSDQKRILESLEKDVHFKQLFDSHYPKVLRLCKGYFGGDDATAADAAQEIFINVWQHLNGFRNESRITTWIYRISVNTCLSYLRKSSKTVNTLERLPEIALEDYSEEKEAQLHKMYECIQKLNARDKMIILLLLEDVTYAEIADVVGMTEETLRVKIHRIKKNLTKCVQS